LAKPKRARSGRSPYLYIIRFNAQRRPRDVGSGMGLALRAEPKKIRFDISLNPFMFGLTCLFELEELGLATKLIYNWAQCLAKSRRC